MLRDKFAMAAMQGFCANMGFYSINDDVAERAYQMADAMMRERQNWDFSNDPEQPTGFIVSDTPIKRIPLEKHEATQGKAVLPKPAYESAGKNTRAALTEAIKEQTGRDVYCNGFSIAGLISVLETGGTIGLTEELTPAGHTTKLVLRDAIKRFHGHDNASITDPLEVLIDRLERGLPF